MSKVIHVLMKIKDQTTDFDGKTYPYYEVGWKKGEHFYLWNGLMKTERDLDEWEEI